MAKQTGNLQVDQFATATNLHQRGRLKDAEIIYRQIITANPNHGDALHNLGLLLLQQGSSAPARDFFERAIVIKPDNVDFQINLGQALKNLGDGDGALKCLKKALAIDPAHHGANLNMANFLIETGDEEHAEICLKKVLRKQPDNPAALMNMGVVLTKMKKFTKATRMLEKANKLAPNSVAILVNFGVALLGEKNYAQSLECLDQAIAIDPMHTHAHYNRGRALNALNQYDDALAAYEKSIDLGHDKLTTLLVMKEVALEAKHFDQAISYLETIIEIDPDDYASVAQLAFTLAVVGQIDQAKDLALQVIAHNPNDTHACHFLAHSYDMTGNHDFISNLERLAKDKSLSAEDSARIHYARTSLFERQGDYNLAFSSMKTAADILFKELDGEVVNQEKLLKQINKIFTAELMDRANATVLAGKSQPIFIVGMPRSGTTLTEQIIAGHSKVFGAGELSNISHLDLKHGAGMGKKVRLDSFYKQTAALETENLRKLGEAYIDAAPPHDEPFFTDKMPGNFLFIGLIHMLFPTAPIIHCRREAADTCLSCYRQHFKHELTYTYDLRELGRFYRFYEQLMEFWHQLLPGRILDIRYEDTVEDTEAQAKKLIDYCGLEWEEACLDFHNSTRPIETASIHQVRKPIYKTSVKGWRRYEKQLAPLFAALGPYAPDEYLKNK